MFLVDGTGWTTQKSLNERGGGREVIKVIPKMHQNDVAPFPASQKLKHSKRFLNLTSLLLCLLCANLSYLSMQH